MIKKIIKKNIYIYIYIKVLKKRAKFVPPQSLRLKKKNGKCRIRRAKKMDNHVREKAQEKISLYFSENSNI